jgi:hypothetical protein
MGNLKIFFFILLFFSNFTYASAQPYVDKQLLDKIGAKYKVFAKKGSFIFKKH